MEFTEREAEYERHEVTADDVDPRLYDYYETRFVEAERLSRREGQLEILRTKELLERFLPDPPLRVIDIGGGTGVYASWLADRGYRVHLVDIVRSHVEAAAQAGTFTSVIGDARGLTEGDGSFDVALLLGPTYHLIESGERIKALREARRVVKSNGWVVVAYISRLAVALDGFVKGWMFEGRGPAGIEQVVEVGTDQAGASFGPIAYFHRPTEIKPELESAGLEVLNILGVEGPGWISPDFDDRWSDPGSREAILKTARICESDQEMLGLSAHLLAFARS